MRIQRLKPTDAKTERDIVTSMIVDDSCCREIRARLDQRYLQSTFSKTVAKWCSEYYEAYEEAPKKQIEHIYERQEPYLDEDLSHNIKSFLQSLSSEYEEREHFNAKYWIDYAKDYFKRRAYKQLAHDLDEAASDDVQAAEDVLNGFNISIDTLDTSRDILSQENVQRLMLSEEMGGGNQLFNLPGAWGQLFGTIERDTFIGFLGREKIGKSYLMQEIAFQAAMAGLNVAIFDVGDQSVDQSDRRMYSWLTGKSHKKRRYNKRLVPVLDCKKNQNGECEYGDEGLIDTDADGKEVGLADFYKNRDHEVCTECWKDREYRHVFEGSIWFKEQPVEVWKWNEAYRKAAWFKKRFRGRILAENWPMKSTSAKDIRRWILTRRDQEGFIPDLVIVDYADDLLPDINSEFRHQENDKWQTLRSISQEFHCCMISGSQADAKSYKKKILTLDNFSEDKRKFGHVTHFFSLNRTGMEQKSGILRLGQLLIREDDLEVVSEVSLLQNLDRGRAHAGSFFGRMPGI